MTATAAKTFDVLDQVQLISEKTHIKSVITYNKNLYDRHTGDRECNFSVCTCCNCHGERVTLVIVKSPRFAGVQLILSTSFRFKNKTYHPKICVNTAIKSLYSITRVYESSIITFCNTFHVFARWRDCFPSMLEMFGGLVEVTAQGGKRNG